MRKERGVLLVALVASLAACGDRAASSDPNGTVEGTVGGRTYTLKVPADYDPSRPLPLIVAIHAYASTSGVLESYFGLDPLADERGFFVVYPTGTVDEAQHRFFTATDACCDFYDTGVDDVAFIEALLDAIDSAYAIDPRRVYAVGHSNGGFMSYRLACDLSARFAAIVSLEGAMWNDPSRCKPTSPVAVLEVHGTDDVVINPAGGNVVDGYPDRVYPPLAETVGDWAFFDGCSEGPLPGPDPGAIDSETPLPTTSQVWSGCRAGADVELWLNQGGTHTPQLTSVWPGAIVDFLLAHPKNVAETVAVHGPDERQL